jgi:signal transduction histidine kinase
MQLEALCANSPAAVLVLDDACILKRCNFAADKLLAFSCQSSIGKPLSALLQAADIAPETLNTVEKHLQQQQPFRTNLKLHAKTVIWDAVAVPLKHGDEWVIIISDVSALAELSDLKTRMLRMASHDLKNPLSVLMGYGGIILHKLPPDGNAETIRYVKAMLEAADNMLTIITDILQLEHFRSGILEKHPVDLGELVSGTLRKHTFDVERKQQTLHCEFADNLPTISGSRMQLSQAFSNLIGNAIKYTPDGGEITLRLRHSDRMARFEVEDNGYGIPDEDQKKLFQEFYRGYIKNARNIPGTGLGLSLVKAVIEAHGGRVWVQSKEGAGSTFFVELPCQEDVDR